MAQLADGRLVLISRPEGDIAWSTDLGRTWTKPVPLGIRLFEPRLITLRDGASSACTARMVQAASVRCSATTAADMALPGTKWGYPVDPSVYGYGQAGRAG